MDIELYMVERPGGNIKGSYPGQVNKGTRFYKDMRGVRTFLSSYPNAKVYLIVGKMYDVTDDCKIGE